MEPGKLWPRLPSPVGMFVDVRRVINPPKEEGAFDLVFEPTGLFFGLAIDAEERGIGLVEDFFSTALGPAVVFARDRNEEGAIGKPKCPTCKSRRTGF
jgi:hypothetical protein